MSACGDPARRVSSAAMEATSTAAGEDASALAVQALTALGAAAGGAAVEVCGAVRLERGAGRATVLLCAGHAVCIVLCKLNSAIRVYG